MILLFYLAARALIVMVWIMLIAVAVFVWAIAWLVVGALALGATLVRSRWRPPRPAAPHIYRRVPQSRFSDRR